MKGNARIRPRIVMPRCGSGPLRVTTGKAQDEHKISASPPRPGILHVCEYKPWSSRSTRIALPKTLTSTTTQAVGKNFHAVASGTRRTAEALFVVTFRRRTLPEKKLHATPLPSGAGKPPSPTGGEGKASSWIDRGHCFAGFLSIG